MFSHDRMSGQDSCGLDTSLSSVRIEPTTGRHNDRSSQRNMGLRPKACPPVRSDVLRSERPVQGQVDRCLSLLSVGGPTPHLQTIGSGASTRSPFDATDGVSSHISLPEQAAHSSQTMVRDRLQTRWDVLPTQMRCDKQCFICGRPCNRQVGKYYIRLADDNPAHLCFHHDLHELYGE